MPVKRALLEILQEILKGGLKDLQSILHDASELKIAEDRNRSEIDHLVARVHRLANLYQRAYEQVQQALDGEEEVK
jgi:hypothetical protein